ncbi:MAG: M23 family metallopeptidase [Candidatus Andeanibacterium colombiense]|uniref:M23 family metallopeptidase n=1 Tax=Candidatus Andeanibacterium colombiense TaxID=3121345 RepID=A0AAJ5X7L8_9SPHN|nr:MAG: M23 family metallopeptidase [Sphingomonadaceae bacterium]
MRSQGQVRFIKVSARIQMIGAAAVAGVLLFWVVTMLTVAISQLLSRYDRIDLIEREAAVEKSESRVQKYRDNINGVVQDLKARQDFLDKTSAGLADIPAIEKAATHDSKSAQEAAKTVSKVSMAVPGAAALVQIEARQLAYVEKITRFANLRSAQASSALRKLGLDANAMLRSSRSAQGGPLELLSTGRGSIDPRFEKMGLSVARMESLEDMLESLPQVLPAADWSISSGFGYRADPFTGRGAMHAGLDFRAGYGAPIHAAAKGRVSFVGQRSGYGNVVEIDHSNGLMTRYAHMSAFHARIGTEVAAGDLIGAIGSTGRSTGPHLHFEVRINDRAVNPRPFLEAASHVLEKTPRTAAIPHRS